MAELVRRGKLASGFDDENQGDNEVECIDLSDGTWKEPVTVCELGAETTAGVPLNTILYHVVGAMNDDDPLPRLKKLAAMILEEL